MKPTTAVKTALRLNALQKQAQSAVKETLDTATCVVSAALPLGWDDDVSDQMASGAPASRTTGKSEVPRFAVVGHTNAGKTSLLRTLTRQVDFGQVSDQPGTTRHAQAIDLRFDGRVAARFIDTPGLEDSIALLRYLNTLEADSRLGRIGAFLRGPEARASFEQEAKVLRALLEQADAALLVIDTREPVLPKFRAEIEILTWCAKPIMPVLNFVRDAAREPLRESSRAGAPGFGMGCEAQNAAIPSSIESICNEADRPKPGCASRDGFVQRFPNRRDDWHQMLREAGLHARVEFDVVAPFNGSEQRLYADLATLLPARRQQLAGIVQALAEQARQLRQAACRAMASSLIDVAAMRRVLPSHDLADEARQQAFVRDFQDGVHRHARRGVDDLLAVFAFRPNDAELAGIPLLAGRWEDDLFNPELLKKAGKRLGLGVIIGAGIGAVGDVALAGLSLGAAATLGAALGGAASGGWQPLWRKLKNRLDGVRELTVEDPLLLLLADRLLALAHALEQRGHAAQDRLQVDGALPSGVGEGGVDDGLHDVVSALEPARSHPEWERGNGTGASDAQRQALEIELARGLECGLEAVREAA